MKSASHAIVFAALLAGCGSASQQHGDDKDQPLPSGQGAFGQAFTWEWRKQNAPAAPSSTPAATLPAAAAVGAKPPDDANTERQEFEEWKRKNQK